MLGLHDDTFVPLGGEPVSDSAIRLDVSARMCRLQVHQTTCSDVGAGLLQESNEEALEPVRIDGIPMNRC